MQDSWVSDRYCTCLFQWANQNEGGENWRHRKQHDLPQSGKITQLNPKFIHRITTFFCVKNFDFAKSILKDPPARNLKKNLPLLLYLLGEDGLKWQHHLKKMLLPVLRHWANLSTREMSAATLVFVELTAFLTDSNNRITIHILKV